MLHSAEKFSLGTTGVTRAPAVFDWGLTEALAALPLAALLLVATTTAPLLPARTAAAAAGDL
jgi:hypothetical protein